MASQRIYRTNDGRHVPEGHAEAAFLAYTQYDEVPDDVAAEVKKGGRPSDKQAAKPEDKARRTRRAKSPASEGDSGSEE